MSLTQQPSLQPPHVDVLLVTVTDTEIRAVFAVLQETLGRQPIHQHIAGKTYYDLGVIRDARVWLVRSEMGTATPGGALPTIANAIDALLPHAILMVGIAFGMDAQKQRIGDVLVAQRLMLYDYQRVGTATDALVVDPRGDRITVSPVLLDRVRHSTLGWPPDDTDAPTVHVGLVLSGDKLIDNHTFREQLREREREAIGGEMEGAGLYLAASQRKVDWLLVKAICDWADGTKVQHKDQYQHLAARNAAAFTFHMLRQGGFGTPPLRHRWFDALLPRQETVADTNRRRMLDKVEAYWIRGVLDQSLEQVARIELGLQHAPDAVAHPLDAIIRRPGYADQTIPLGTPVLSVFDAAGGELLILGAPGAGKTTLLLELTRDLLARARQDATYPIPVIFNLSSWASRRPPLWEWLMTELNERYDVPRKLARQWVAANAVLPLLDGLDEVAETHRDACVAALNTFRQVAGLLPIVVCSRSADYARLSTQVRLSHAVEVQPLPQARITTYLNAAGCPLAGVRVVLQDDPTFWDLLDTPLMLSIVTLAYQGQSAQALRAGTLAERRGRVFVAYIDRMFARRVGQLSASEAQVRWWLCWLAAQLVQRQQTMFVIEQMQPDWLPRRYQWVSMWSARLLGGLGGGLLGGLGGGLVNGLIFGLFSGWSAYAATIAPVDRVQWHWSREGLIVGLTLGFITGLGPGFFSGLGVSLIIGIGIALGMGLMFGLLTGLIFGFKPISVHTTTKPNQGIHRSAANAGGFGLACGLIAGMILGLITGLIFGHTAGVRIGLFVCASAMVIGSLFGGGRAVLQHYILRLLLWHLKLLPLCLVPFLDACVERILLRRVGGGYIFVHRLLMEHLAAMTPERVAQLVADGEAREKG